MGDKERRIPQALFIFGGGVGNFGDSRPAGMKSSAKLTAAAFGKHNDMRDP